MFQALSLAVFGIIVPWIRGWNFLDLRLLAAYALLGPLFAVAMLTERLTQADSQWTRFRREALRALGICYGLNVLVYALGFATVNFKSRFGRILPENEVLLLLPILALSTTLLATMGAMWMVVRQGNVAAPRRILRVFLFALLVGWIFVDRFAPPEWREAQAQLFTREGLRGLTLTAFLISVSLSAMAWVTTRRRLAPQ